MVKVRGFVFAFAFVLVVCVSIGFVSAALDVANFSLVGPTFFDLANNNTINITITAVSQNITSVNITYQYNNAASDAHEFSLGSNGTNANAHIFTNNTIGSVTVTSVLFFANSSATPLIINQSTANFWFTVSSPRAIQSLLAITINASGGIAGSNTTTINLYPAFAFTGYVLNETGCSTCWQNWTNVSIYGLTNAPGGGPATETLLASTLTNASGYFRLSRVNNSAFFRGFKLKTIYYDNVTSQTNATKVGTIMPDFPSFMFYGGGSGEEGEFDMSLNGGTFYLQPAITIKMYATNGTSNVTFGYELIDQALGFPIESSMQSKVGSATVIVPANRAYVVTQMRMFGFPGSSIGYTNDQSVCTSTNAFMNDSICPTPPKSQSITAAQALPGSTIVVNQSLAMTRVNIHGCISIAANANNTQVNITAMVVRMLPWSTDIGSFIPPSTADDGTLNITRDINISRGGNPDPLGANCYAYYNISVLNSTGYMLEIYAKNASNAAGNPGSANNLAGFKNISQVTGHLQYNITLHKLAGNYVTSATGGVTVNTSLIKINVVNSTGGSISTNMDANIKVKNVAVGIGTVYYIIGFNNILNGSFYIPVLNNSNFAKVMVFSQNGPPKETTINLSLSEFNITVASMGVEKGFRKFASNGSLDSVNTASVPISLRFLRTDAECDAPNAPSSCVITEMNASSFNPMKAMLAGKVNMEVKLTASNVSLIFHDYDMFSAKQPPMESVIDNDAARAQGSGSDRVEDRWNFGSFAPADSYDNVTIVIPYSDNTAASTYLNDSAQVNVTIPILYDENNNVVWNRTRGDVDANLTDDFADYNITDFRNFTQSSGFACLTDYSNRTCYINTSGNYLSFRIPHFSTIGASVLGQAIASSTTSTTTTTTGGSTSGGGDNNVNTTTKKSQTWTKITPGNVTIMKVNDKALGVKQISIYVANEAQNVKITITKHDGKPAAVSVEKTGKVYKYLEIKTENLANKLARATLSIQVEKSWLTSQGLKTDKVALYKFNENSKVWEEVTIRSSGSDGTYQFFDADLNSFSYFAIGEKTVAAMGDLPAGNNTNGTTDTPMGDTPLGDKGSMIWIIIIIVIIIIAVVIGVIIYHSMRKH